MRSRSIRESRRRRNISAAAAPNRKPATWASQAIPLACPIRANWPTNQKIKKIEAGTVAPGTNETVDGVSFFNTTHPIRNKEATTQSNLITGAGTTLANLQDDFEIALARMKKFQDEGGEPFHGDMPADLWVLCPPELERRFREVLEATLVNTTDNVQAGAASIVTSPRFSDDNDWYLMSAFSGLRPIIYFKL